MSLEDKLYDKIQFYVYANESGYVDGIQDASKQCVQICDEFTVGFAEWMQQNTIYNGSEYYAYIGNSQQYKLNKLLEIYKQGL